MEENVAINSNYTIKEELNDPEALVNISGVVNEPEVDVDVKQKPCCDVKSEGINESLTQVITSETLFEDGELKMPLHEEVFLKYEGDVSGAEAEEQPIAYSNNEGMSDYIENMYEPPIADVKEIKEEVDEISQFDDNIELISSPIMKLETGEEIVTCDSVQKSFQCIFCKMQFPNQETIVKHIEQKGCSRKIQEKIFECPKCKKKFTCKMNSEIHIKNCIKCEVCQKPFSNMGLFNKHLKTHDNYFKCEICQEIYTSRRQFTKHKKIHTHEVAYECNQCKVRFNSVTLIKFHMKTHAESESQQNIRENLQCEICKREFVRKHTFEQHMIAHNSAQPLLSCNVCQKKYLHVSVLKQHMKTHSVNNFVHSKVPSKSLVSENTVKQYAALNDKKKFECTICLRKFLHKNTLNLHMTIHTEINASFECHICKEKFYRRFNLDLHLQLHKKETTAQCKICLKIFSSNLTLHVHNRIHTTNAPVECAICHKKFALKSYLRKHMIVHRVDRALFECNICHKECKRRSILRRHMTRHRSSKKLFECNVCRKKFPTKHNLTSHMRMHTDKLHECTKCEKKYRWKRSLSKHIKEMHVEVNKNCS